MPGETEKRRTSLRDWVPVFAIILSLIATALTWTCNERNKRIDEQSKRKEARYTKLIDAARGFYARSSDKDLQLEFLKQVELCWLYCPDGVIEKAYAFLNSVHTKTTNKYTPEQHQRIIEESLQELILAIRKDLIGRKRTEETHLKPEDFQILVPTNQ